MFVLLGVLLLQVVHAASQSLLTRDRAEEFLGTVPLVPLQIGFILRAGLYAAAGHLRPFAAVGTLLFLDSLGVNVYAV